METIANDQAFPKPNSEGHNDGSEGLTKREYFAAMALQGFISTGQYRSGAQIADEAVHCADMLIIRLNQ